MADLLRAGRGGQDGGGKKTGGHGCEYFVTKHEKRPFWSKVEGRTR